MASAKQDESQKKEGAEQHLYIPPTAVPNESEYRTLDDLRVRLADDIDPRLAATEVPRRRGKREPARLRPVRFVALGALALGAVLAWGLSEKVVSGPSATEGQDSVLEAPAAGSKTPVELTTLQPAAPGLGGSAPQVVPATAEPHEMSPEAASGVATASLRAPEIAAHSVASSAARGTRAPRTAPKPSRPARMPKRDENEKAAAGGEGPSPVEASGSGNKVWVKPPGRKVWMK